jgi:hypothetical protein
LASESVPSRSDAYGFARYLFSDEGTIGTGGNDTITADPEADALVSSGGNGNTGFNAIHQDGARSIALVSRGFTGLTTPIFENDADDFGNIPRIETREHDFYDKVMPSAITVNVPIFPNRLRYKSPAR